MKRLFKTFALSVIACALCACIAVAGCGGSKAYNGTYVGEYSYMSDETHYGIKVSVVVENDVIQSVTKLESDLVEVSPAIPDVWSEQNVANWNDNLSGLLEKYKGKTVAEIKAIKVTVAADGLPTLSAEEFNGLVISGATQSSGRLLLAVQNALK